MSFKIITNLIPEHPPEAKIDPVIEGSRTVYRCKDFTGELSSVTGIIHQFMFIPRLVDRFNGVTSEEPTVRIICGPECHNGCHLTHKPHEISQPGADEASRS